MLAPMREVSKSDLTLEQCIAQNIIEKPDLMEFNDWQKWRRVSGTRPRVKEDGRSTTSAQEAALWKATMLRMYGDSWNIQLALERHALEESSRRAEAEETERSEQRGVAPPAGSVGALAVDRPSSPGSGHEAYSAPGPGSGSQSPSWHSFDPGSPNTLTAKVLKDYDPAKESLEKNENRI